MSWWITALEEFGLVLGVIALSLIISFTVIAIYGIKKVVED